MTNDELDDIKNALAEASDDQKRDVARRLHEDLPTSDTDNRTHVGFRTTLADKSALHRIATAANTTVSAICRSAMRAALHQSFGDPS
jgi:hypothetical protein